MTDLPKHLYVDVHCDRCGDFAIRADVIAESQRLLANGCPGSAYECPPELYATLLEPADLESLQRAWSNLDKTTRSPLRQVSVNDGLRVCVDPLRKLDPMAISRWEDDGGYVADNVEKCRHAPGSSSFLTMESNREEASLTT